MLVNWRAGVKWVVLSIQHRTIRMNEVNRVLVTLKNFFVGNKKGESNFYLIRLVK